MSQLVVMENCSGDRGRGREEEGDFGLSTSSGQNVSLVKMVTDSLGKIQR